MRTINLLSAAAILLATAGIAQAGALIVENRTDRAIWVTHMNSLGMQYDYRCLPAGGSTQGNNFTMDVVYLRGELKPDKKHCNGKTLNDTGKGQPIMVGTKTTKYFVATGNKLQLR